MSKTARFNEILESVASFTEIHQEFSCQTIGPPKWWMPAAFW